MTSAALPLTDTLRCEGLSVDIRFGEPRPTFGDLYLICGQTHPAFPPTDRSTSGAIRFEDLANLQFSQVDDYFGVLTLPADGDRQEGDDVAVWLYPLVDGEPVDHHPGPFDGIRLSYCVLRHPPRRAEHFLTCIDAFARLGTRAFYRERARELGVPPDLAPLRADVAAIVEDWAENGVAAGSDAALEIDF
ncbi:hypothetical protein [Alienimonas chondri]|uniref:Uncharacterized protein n=1 Tax=Alienimonas chondri TaxID=2681879 RepID=A0ABX1VHB3_9PLAN|nr:hypothetical protein [Alienimonas chondri]NNJ26648.1 hypothetical protein [Alienimonas chondri]